MSGVKGKVDNGQRLPAAFGAWEGMAGVCERGAGAKDVAIFADLKQVRSAKRGTIENVEHEVLAIARSQHVDGMLVLSVRAVEGIQ